jgi:peptidoglycan hydrolase-like protein with peptidoglycan-binding domain
MNNVDSFVQSPNIGGQTGGKRKVAIIIHDEEYPEVDTAAEDVQAFFSRSSTQASTNAAIDNDTIAGCVDYDQIAWHTGAGSPHNWTCEGYEHSGYAHQTEQEWLDPYGIAMLERSAAFVAWRCHELGLPVRKINADQYLAALRDNDPSQGGIMGHYDITVACNVLGGHTDPGPGFPWDYYISRVQAHYGGDAGPTPAPTYADPVVYRRNSAVQPNTTTEIQRLLTELADKSGDATMNPGAIDGVFGPNTENAVIAFQQRALSTTGTPLVVDGIVGPQTITSMRVCVYLSRLDQATPTIVLTADPAPAFPGVVQRGSYGSTVTRVQQRLNGRWIISVDGVFGPETDNVTRLFQTDRTLDVDGIVGPFTWAALWATPIA